MGQGHPGTVLQQPLLRHRRFDPGGPVDREPGPRPGGVRRLEHPRLERHRVGSLLPAHARGRLRQHARTRGGPGAVVRLAPVPLALPVAGQRPGVVAGHGDAVEQGHGALARRAERRRGARRPHALVTAAADRSRHLDPRRRARLADQAQSGLGPPLPTDRAEHRAAPAPAPRRGPAETAGQSPPRRRPGALAGGRAGARGWRSAFGPPGAPDDPDDPGQVVS